MSNLVVISDLRLAERYREMLRQHEEMTNNGEYTDANIFDVEDMEVVRREIVARWMYEQGYRI